MERSRPFECIGDIADHISALNTIVHGLMCAYKDSIPSGEVVENVGTWLICELIDLENACRCLEGQPEEQTEEPPRVFLNYDSMNGADPRPNTSDEGGKERKP